MGLIRAAFGAAGGVLADQWKEYFYCEALDKETLMVKGQKVVGNRSSNTRGSDNVITNGSGIVVADGQCMIIVDQGEIVDICAEPGQFTFDSSSEPSVFTEGLGQGIKLSFKKFCQRFTMGGSTGHDQRVYYFNTKELVDNKFGTPNPIPFRIVDQRLNLDLDVSVRCSGVYSFKIDDPILFYKNVCGNVSDEYKRSELSEQMRTEFISALQPAFGRLSELGLRPNQIVTHNKELEEAMNAELSGKWMEIRGFKIVSVALGSVTLPEEDQAAIKRIQQGAALSNPALAAGVMAGSTAAAMESAASNEGGAMNGFVGMGMAGGMGMNNMAGLFQQGGQPIPPVQGGSGQGMQAAAPNQAAGTWTCPKCGSRSTGKFCPECGEKKPEASGWFCPECGTKCSGKFCPSCGTKKPE